MAMNNSLAEVHPELVSEWSEKDMPLKPDEVNAKSRKQDLDCQQLVSGITGEEKISDADLSSVACWVYVQKYVKQKTLDEMLQELPGAGQFIIVMNTWFERLMAD